MLETRHRMELFGGLRVVQGEEVITRFRTQKVAGVLAYLALSLGQAVSRDQLIDAFWPEMEPTAARDNLSTTLSALRRQLEAQSGAGSVLQADHQRVRLQTDAVTADVHEFRTLLASATRATTDPQRATLLEQAIALYRGDLLPDWYEDWSLQAQRYYGECYEKALFQWSEALIRCGNLEAALTAVQRLSQRDPYHEEAVRQQMRLHAALGRPALALDLAQELAKRLQDEMGVAPATATRRLVQQIQAGEFPEVVAPSPLLQTIPPTETAAAPVRPATPPRTPSLPLPLTRFFGREAEITQLLALLTAAFQAPSAGRLITLLGPGGMGKTRLSIEVAQRMAPVWEGRVWFVSLGEIPNGQLLPYTLAQALKLPMLAVADPLDQAVERLSEAPSLLILDNFEHLLGEQEEGEKHSSGRSVLWVRLLLERVPNVVCLVTSRAPLHLGGEQEFPLMPLALPQIGDAPEHRLASDSLALFLDRARAVKPDFALSPHNAETLATLCHRLEGMPLAIEMAAAWVKTLPPARILERLEHQLDLLVSRRRDLPSRHQSLRAAIEWSYDLLAPELRPFFARLSVFRGGWNLEAMEQVVYTLPSPLSSLEILATLQEQSLIMGEETAEEPQWRMLETLREFAAEKLAESGEAMIWRRRHAAYFGQIAEEKGLFSLRPDSLECLERLQAAHENLLSALGASPPVLAPNERLRIATALSRFWEMRGYLALGTRQLREVLNLAPERTTLRAMALNRLATLHFLQAHYADASASYTEALAISQTLGDPRNEATALHGLGNIALFEQDYAEAERQLTAACALRKTVGDLRELAASHHGLGNLAMRQGNQVQGRIHLEESLRLRRQDGDRLSVARSLGALGQLLWSEDDLAGAAPIFLEAMEIFREMGTPWLQVLCLNDLMRIIHAGGNLEQAARLGGAIIKYRDACNYPLPPTEQAENRRFWEEVAHQLGPRRFTACWEEGERLTLEAAIACAQQEVKALF